MKIFTYALDCLFKVWTRLTGLELTGRLEWCIEKDGWKQDWIKHTFNPKQLFGDIFELQKEGWKGYDRMTETVQQVYRWVKAIAAGFECDSCSSYHRWSKSNKQCIETGESKTGSTAHAVFDIIHYLKDVLFGWLENVKTLGQKNLLALIELMNKRGMMVITNSLDSKDYGSGARRGRQWFLLAFVGKVDQLSSKWKEPKWVKSFQSILVEMQIGAGNLADFLFPAGHQILKTALEGNLLERKLKDKKEEKANEIKKNKRKLPRPAVNKRRSENWRTTTNGKPTTTSSSRTRTKSIRLKVSINTTQSFTISSAGCLDDIKNALITSCSA